MDTEICEGEFSVEFADGEAHSYDSADEAGKAIADEAFRQDMSTRYYLDHCIIRVPLGFDADKWTIPDPIRLYGSIQKTPHVRCPECQGSSFNVRKSLKGEGLACKPCAGTGVKGEAAFRAKRVRGRKLA